MTEQTDKTLPGFADRMMARSDANAEALIGQVRMFVSGVLFVTVAALLFRIEPELYALRETELKAAFVVTLAYFSLGLVSFVVAKSSWYRPFHGLVFALFEVSLVLANLYFDVQDSDTNSLFALASPRVLMLTLVLVLQVFRYRLAIHVVVSALLIMGVSLLIFFDVQMPITPPPRVMDELVQMYSPPPNAVRIIMLIVLATIVGLSISRSRRMMGRIAHELEENHNRNRFLPQELSGQMSDEDLQILRKGKNCDAAVMFVDIRGFTKLTGQLSTEETAQLLTAYRSLVMDAVLANNGIIDKFIGDGVMCVFGLETSFDVAAKDAVNAGKTLISGLDQWNVERAERKEPELDIVVVVHGGPVFAAAIGDDRRLEFTVTGPTVNTASRMESWAKEFDKCFVVSQRVAETVNLGMKGVRPVGDVLFRGDLGKTRLLEIT